MMASVFLRWHRPDIVWISSLELFEYLAKKLNGRWLQVALAVVLFCGAGKMFWSV
jgi:hypothetical protein